METTCEFCLTKCTSKVYKNHKTDESCQKYKDVLFTCLKCNFSTVGIRNIEEHILLCKFNKKPIQKTQDMSESLLCIERTKNKIYRQIIRNNTTIKLDDFIEDKDDGLHIYKVTNGIIPVFTHGDYKNEKQKTKEKSKPVAKKTVDTSNITPVVKKTVDTSNITPIVKKTVDTSNITPVVKKREKRYRTINKCIDLVEETPSELVIDHIKAIDCETEIYINLEEANKEFEKCLSCIKDTRVYTKSLQKMKKTRSRLLSAMSLENYCVIVKSHVQSFKEIFQSKKYSARKIINITTKGLTSLEMRLIYFGEYTTSHLEVENMESFDKSLTSSISFPKHFSPFVHSEFYQKFHNYGSVLFSVKHNIKRYLLNKYEFWNVIYLPLPQSTDTDPYSFYTFEKFNKGLRCWKMDCRLDELSQGFQSTMKEYFISIFRKLYCDVFHDNVYRKDYKNKSQVTEYDCEQLLHNIFFINNLYDFTKTMQSIVIENCNYKPTLKDRFDIRADDTLQRRKFTSSSKKTPDVVDIIKRLFDGISSENAVDLYRDISI
jgi:hypothetical protein